MNRGTGWYRFIRGFVKHVILRLLGGMRTLNSSREPAEGALIVAPVHLSFIDPPLVGCAMRRAITFMAKEELFRPFLLGPLIRSLGAFPVRRGAGDTEAIRLAIKLLQEGRAVLMFPEGTRGDGKTLGALTPGIAMLAKRTGARVLPLGLVGTEKVLPRGASKPRRSPMTVVFGETFTYAEVCGGEGDKNARNKFNEELERRLLALSAEGGLALKTEPRTTPQTKVAAPEPATEI